MPPTPPGDDFVGAGVGVVTAGNCDVAERVGAAPFVALPSTALVSVGALVVVSAPSSIIGDVGVAFLTGLAGGLVGVPACRVWLSAGVTVRVPGRAGVWLLTGRVAPVAIGLPWTTLVDGRTPLGRSASVAVDTGVTSSFTVGWVNGTGGTSP